MQTTPTLESTVALLATATPNDTIRPAASNGRRNPASRTLGKLMSILRGDKYMANAYPPAWHSAANGGSETAGHGALDASQTKER